MRVLRLDGTVTEQAIPLVDVDDPVPAEAHAMTLARYLADAPAEVPAALALPNDVDVEDIEVPWNTLGAIWLDFPSFSDGRAYSQARILRERLGFRGEILARGDVLRDQIFYMSRCGFDAFALRDDQSVEACQAALADFSVAYRKSTGASDSIFSRRRAQTTAA